MRETRDVNKFSMKIGIWKTKPWMEGNIRMNFLVVTVQTELVYDNIKWQVSSCNRDGYLFIP